MGLFWIFYIDINVFVDGHALNCHIDHVLEGLVEVVADPVDNEIIENSYNWISFNSIFKLHLAKVLKLIFPFWRGTVVIQNIFKFISNSLPFWN